MACFGWELRRGHVAECLGMQQPDENSTGQGDAETGTGSDNSHTCATSAQKRWFSLLVTALLRDIIDRVERDVGEGGGAEGKCSPGQRPKFGELPTISTIWSTGTIQKCKGLEPRLRKARNLVTQNR